MDDRRYPFAGKRILIGTVHLRALPGAPGFAGNLDDVFEAALKDARAYVEAGFDGLIVENFGDSPFLPGPVGPHTVAIMTRAASLIQEFEKVPLGLNVLRNDGRAALGIARATGAAFVRINVFTGVAATDQGIIQGEAHDLVRYRKRIGCRAAILADVHVKHGRPLSTPDIAQAARDAFSRGRADGLIVTGPATGAPPDPADLEAVAAAVPEAPLVAGSGLDPDNAQRIFALARAAIVGSFCKEGGAVDAPVDASRAARLVRAVHGAHAAGTSRQGRKGRKGRQGEKKGKRA